MCRECLTCSVMLGRWSAAGVVAHHAKSGDASRSRIGMEMKRIYSGLRRRNGQGGIRTLDTLAGMPVFETGSFSHSDTCPTNKNVQGCKVKVCIRSLVTLYPCHPVTL